MSLKPFCRKFKDSPASRADYLELNGLNEVHGQKHSSYLFSVNYSGLRWLKRKFIKTR